VTAAGPVSDEPAWRGSSAKRLQAKIISVIGYPTIALLGSTLRWRTDGLEHLAQIVAGGRQPVMAFWHGRILTATYFFRRRGIVVITSENFDGEWIAGVIERFGYGTARGSTSRGARKALLQLTRSMAGGKAAGFTVDGPRGPARVAQPGAVWLAQATGNPVLPFHLEADRYWSLASWDRTQIPKPFARVALAVGQPFDVPAGDETAIERGRLELETRLRALEKRAAEMLGDVRIRDENDHRNVPPQAARAGR
jgi:lysophospholipid acyltransferase (LPLAT)-like uncharacterized protein